MSPAVVAHRGASAHHRENTLAAFEAAVEAGADLVEFDVRRTAGGGLVVIHDPTLASGAAVSELTPAEIRSLQPEIPTLDEVLEQFRGRVAFEVEIKNVPGEPGYEASGTTIARNVSAALRRHEFADAFVASFDLDCLRSVREVHPGMATGLLVDASWDLRRALELTAAGRHAFLLPEAGAVRREGRAFVDRVHALDIRICAWTVDDPAAMKRLFELGVDAVETNDPGLGVRVRDSLAQG